MPTVKPGLVIGVGGTGYWILSLLKRQLYINHGLKTDEIDELEFLVLDTLSEDNFEEYSETTGGSIISIISDFQVNRSEYLHMSEPPEGFFNWADDPEKYGTQRYRWFRRDILKQYVQDSSRWPLREGAAQIRQYGRMAFFFNINRIAAAINEKLTKIKKHAGTASIPVWIFGSFAGGTGSGMMLDVAMLVRIIQEQFNQPIRTIGVIILPEVFTDKLTTSIAQGYAAFRELQRFTSWGTESSHKANEKGKEHTGEVEFYSSLFFYHNKSIFDNVIFFNEDCRNEEKRLGFFNKIADTISILLDTKGADTFLSRIIPINGDKLTSLSTYKIFIPTALYQEKFLYNYLIQRINALFPVNEAGNIRGVEDEKKREVILKDIDNLFYKSVPCFVNLRHFINNDFKAKSYFQEFLVTKPRYMIEKILGTYGEIKLDYSNSQSLTLYVIDEEILSVNIYGDIVIPELDKKNWEAKKEAFRGELEYKYNEYQKIFARSTDNVIRESIKEKITENVIHQVNSYLKDNKKINTCEIYSTLGLIKRILNGENENSPTGIIGILNGPARRAFDDWGKNIRSKLIERTETYDNARPVNKFIRYDFSAVVDAMKALKADKELELAYMQSRNILFLVIEILQQLLAYIESLETKLMDKSLQVSISSHSIKSRYRDEVTKIESILKAGVGYATSIGLESTTLANLKEKYEAYLNSVIFAEETGDIQFNMEFDGEHFILNYSHGNTRYQDNQEWTKEKNEKVTFWEHIEEDIYGYISEKMSLHDGIFNYLSWAKKQYEENRVQSEFSSDLLNSLIPASQDFIKLKKMPEKLQGHLLYGDFNPVMADEIFDLLNGLRNYSNCQTVHDTFQGATRYHINFADKDSLVFVVYSNRIHPSEIDILDRMYIKYKREIQEGSRDWRTRVYHNYKCEWEIMEIEKTLPAVKDAGILTLTHPSFYWVLEESENVALFVSSCAAGIIRKVIGPQGQEYWICAPPHKSPHKTEDEPYIRFFTDPDGTSDLFTALVKFAIEKRPFKRIPLINFEAIKKMRDEAILNQEGKNWQKIKNQFIEEDPFELDFKHYNREMNENDPEGYIKHRNLFLARIFLYYLDELKRTEFLITAETDEEDIAIPLQEEVESEITPPVNLETLESEARVFISNQDYKQGRQKLVEIIKWVPERQQTIQNEFGFLYRFDLPPEEDAKWWLEKKEQIDYRQKLWLILSEKNDFELQEREQETKSPTGEKEITESIEEIQEYDTSAIGEENGVITDDSQLSSQETGEIFENAVLELFRKFFKIAEEEEETLLVRLRKQKAGSQFGYDISFECISKDNENINCKIECKNIKTQIKESDIAHKLLAVENSGKKIDHWILFSARSNPSNDLNKSIETWQDKETFSFDIHIWSPESGIQEFFGLVPGIYKEFYGESTIDGSFPGHWPESKQVEVYQKWKRKLQLKPLSRLPKTWRTYLKQPVQMLLKEERERGSELQMLFDNHVEMHCKDKSGTLLEDTMEDRVKQWLQDSDKDVMFILGEFGDGKTAFTYILARKLADAFLNDPVNGWLPIRFSLNDYVIAQNPQAFLQRRLAEFNADLASWNELRQEKNMFIILDGFDEMSLGLDSQSIRKNIKDLTHLYDEFKGKRIKLLITSRTHFFENKQDEKHLLQRLGKPPVFYLAPIERQESIRYLENMNPSPARKELLKTLHKLHDPLGLASKPLFLQMIETTLNKLQTQKITEATLNQINEIQLYNHYIDECFKRKQEQWEPDEVVDQEEIVKNISRILEQLAIQLQESQLNYISVDDFKWDFLHQSKQKINDFIWNISGTDEEDAASRIQVRSLLARVATADDSCTRPVKFCHRSMREFFVARGIQRALKEDKKQARELLTRLQLNHEILHFTTELMKTNPMENYENNLLDIIKSSKMSNRGMGPGGNAITLLYGLKKELKEKNWSGLNLEGANLAGADLSGMQFIKSSLRDANLDNVILENADLSSCDLKGVRLQETAPVLAITSEAGGQRIFAAYKDNTIREWKKILKKGQTESGVIFENTNGPITWLGTTNGTGLCAITDRELIYYDYQEGDGEQLSQRSRFPIKPRYRKFITRKNLLTILAETGPNTTKTLLVDSQKLEILHSLECEKAFLCDNLGFRAFVVASGKSFLRVARMGTAKTRESLTLPAHELTSLCVYTCKTEKQYLLACGQRDGEVLVWRIDCLPDEWQHNLLLRKQVHEGIVSSLCFLDDSRIVSGGVDRKISILRFGEDSAGLQGKIEQELSLTLRCKGLKIDDVQGPDEAKMLKELIRKAEK